jgi:hypothetical protein
MKQSFLIFKLSVLIGYLLALFAANPHVELDVLPTSLTASTLTSSRGFAMSLGTSGDRLGTSVYLLGDVNQDGYADILELQAMTSSVAPSPVKM